MEYVYEAGRPDDDPLGRILVEMLAYMDNGDWKGKIEELPHELVMASFWFLKTHNSSQGPHHRVELSRAKRYYVKVKAFVELE